jgi:hypothetical protein
MSVPDDNIRIRYVLSQVIFSASICQSDDRAVCSVFSKLEKFS